MIRRFLFLACLWLSAASLLFAQGNSGSILGTITDSSGAVVASAKVSATNTRTSVKVESTADELGNYLFNFLAPGTYRVETEVAGFKKFSREVVLETGRQLRVDVALETGAVTETVNVTAQHSAARNRNGYSGRHHRKPPGHQLADASAGILRTSGCSCPAWSIRDGNAVTQGGLVRKDPYYIDGAHSSNHVWSGNPVNPNPDVIQEFRVVTNSFSAEFGETSGAVMQSTTKSGTNEFHGSPLTFFGTIS